MITFPTSQIQNVDLSHGSSIPHDDARANARLRSQLVHRSSLHKADTYARSALFMRGTVGVGGMPSVQPPIAFRP
jgi:hypothetical protein